MTDKTFFFVDGSHYDRLRRVFDTRLDLPKLGAIAAHGAPIDQSVYFRDERDDAEASRLNGLFEWLRRHGFEVRGHVHAKSEPRERYGTNLVEIAVAALTMATAGDRVLLLAGDRKLEAMCRALRTKGTTITLVSTLQASEKIAPPRILLNAVDRFIDVAQILDQVIDPKPDINNEEHGRQKRGTV
ncbi:NYN domain-containing protein [Agrobacterium rubi]|uniref:NYN domain-containing protein n=2 Tax=Agrobacterium rubi TaxID=28099 RepID=A0AAE7UTF3_9HYPH|nr:NYN domain-containing protein [Agrobacterium rubi]MBP1880617.1 uncharacterized LabA/DUF88 family protein [Agrobacterium rubi]NTE89460.1 NYN domain-containing protein [Agrobacterium rubi]NTF05597.1 NYN domain-containing protein [Agrobacterium rubi]NTF10732.1 NYN domain-containing protein [Agrobacterium rubi]NTF23146.1 NYN domain-containing protein [Agrobacterium rubi]